MSANEGGTGKDATETITETSDGTVQLTDGGTAASRGTASSPGSTPAPVRSR